MRKKNYVIKPDFSPMLTKKCHCLSPQSTSTRGYARNQNPKHTNEMALEQNRNFYTLDMVMAINNECALNAQTNVYIIQMFYDFFCSTIYAAVILSFVHNVSFLFEFFNLPIKQISNICYRSNYLEVVLGSHLIRNFEFRIRLVACGLTF